MPKDKTKDGLSKKERRALETREQQLAAELAEREAKAAKKAAKKAKKHDSIRDRIEDEAAQQPATPSPQQIIAAADKVLTAKGSSKGAIDAAEAAKAKAEAELHAPPAEIDPVAVAVEAAQEDRTPEEIDAEIKARLAEKKRLREEAPSVLAELDRSDDAAVTAYNETYGAAGATIATSTAEVEREVAKLTEPEPPLLSLDEAYERMVESTGRTEEELLAEPEQQAEEVETDKGRVFEVGATSDQDAGTEAFAAPSEAKPEVELNGLGQYKIKGPDGKLRGYTRVTTYIKLIEDKTNLEKWSKRKLLEGVILDQTPDEEGVIVDRLGTIRDLMHNRDVAVAKARKADRKGKLAVGELKERVDAAEKVFKDGVNGLIVELEELGGSKEAANKGTELHALTELYDEHGLDAVAELLTDGKITPADLADIEAYGRAMEASGIRHLEREKFVVDDERKVAGRLDRISLVKFPGMKRAVRVVSDIKTGSIDYGISLSLQLENYASMKGYDPDNPDEREDLKLSRTKGVVIHLPQGTGQCHIYAVDLATGRLGNRITAEGRAFRNTGKKAIDFSVDLADPASVAAAEAATPAV